MSTTPPAITAEFLIATLEEIALLLELKGENPFKIRAYRQGAEILESFEGDAVADARDDKLRGIKGIGDALATKLQELATTGRLAFHQDLRAEFPEGLFELFEVQGLGPKKIKALYEQLAVGSIADLKLACEEHRVSKLAGFGAKTEAKILEALALRDSFGDRFLTSGVEPLVERILAQLRSHPHVSQVSVAGSFRRAKETVHDLDFLVATKEPSLVCEDFTTLDEVTSIIACGDTKASVRLQNGIQCDLRAVSNAQFPFALQYFTGSKEHNVELRSLALKQGLSLNEYGFSSAKEDHAAAEKLTASVHTETELYQALRMSFIPPELRENRGEIAAAQEHQLPRLIELENLRGTFHNHTTASDGRATLAEMVNEAQEMGLSYLGIADHSKASFQARGINEERLAKQILEIRALEKTLDGFRIFAGVEVDILKDGELDFADEVLATLDYSVASVHAVLNLDENAMTKRICRAMENPHVTMLGHPTGRLLLRREASAINHARIIECAAETRTVIELNCSPARLDLDWRWWKRARDLGVVCSINPDAHSTSALHRLGLGVRIARKGWLRREDVLNTRSISEVEKFLAMPKQQRVLPMPAGR